MARRGPDGWHTEYVGVPADGMAEDGAFGSPLLGSDEALRTFAFGGKDICDPCFEDGSTNVPLRLANGDLVKGMAGTLNPAADPEGIVKKRFSADGSHFIFGSSAKFESAGDAAGSIYDRNLKTGTTQVVSTLPDGTTISGGGVGALDVSRDGSRIVVGRLISTDVRGNELWHLYMHLGTSPNIRRPDARDDHRRLLRRHERGRQPGLLHHDRQPRRRHRHQRRHLRNGGRQAPAPPPRV